MPLAVAAALMLAAGTATDPAGGSLSPWTVLPAEDLAGKTGRIALNGHRIFEQRAIPSRAVRTGQPMSFEGASLPEGTTLALAVNLASNAQAWCVLPAPGGHELTHRSPWGKRETRCFADTDRDGRLDAGYFGKLDLIGIPSVRTLKRRSTLPAPVAFTEIDPRTVQGFHVKLTVFYYDLRENGRSPCQSVLPFHLDKAGGDPKRRRLAVALTRDDGTACYSSQSAVLRPEDGAYLPGGPGSTLSFAGATLRIDRITGEALEFTILGGFEPYVIAGRVTRQAVDY
ncbi:MAG TPA: hypothetical protein VF688_13370 [Allosphingosinicella sp.]|jgi:hypothetical protein